MWFVWSFLCNSETLSHLHINVHLSEGSKRDRAQRLFQFRDVGLARQAQDLRSLVFPSFELPSIFGLNFPWIDSITSRPADKNTRWNESTRPS